MNLSDVFSTLLVVVFLIANVQPAQAQLFKKDKEEVEDKESPTFWEKLTGEDKESGKFTRQRNDDGQRSEVGKQEELRDEHKDARKEYRLMRKERKAAEAREEAARARKRAIKAERKAVRKEKKAIRKEDKVDKAYDKAEEEEGFLEGLFGGG